MQDPYQLAIPLDLREEDVVVVLASFYAGEVALILDGMVATGVTPSDAEGRLTLLISLLGERFGSADAPVLRRWRARIHLAFRQLFPARHGPAPEIAWIKGMADLYADAITRRNLSKTRAPAVFAAAVRQAGMARQVEKILVESR